MDPVKEKNTLETYSETGFVSCQVIISTLAIFPDGKKIVGGWTDGTMTCWDAETGSELWNAFGHNECVNDIKVFPDNTKIITGCYDGTVKICNADDGEELREMSVNDCEISCVAVFTNGIAVISGDYGDANRKERMEFGNYDIIDGTIRIWDTYDGNEWLSFSANSGRVTALACIMPRGGDTHWIVSNQDGVCEDPAYSPDNGPCIVVWTSFGDRIQTFYTSHNNPVDTLTIFERETDSNPIIVTGAGSGYEGGRISILDIPSGETIANSTSNGYDFSTKTTKVIMSADNTKIASLAEDGQITIRSIENLEKVRLIIHGYEYIERYRSPHAFDIFPDLKRFVGGAGTNDAKAKIWEINESKFIPTERVCEMLTKALNEDVVDIIKMHAVATRFELLKKQT